VGLRLLDPGRRFVVILVSLYGFPHFHSFDDWSLLESAKESGVRLTMLGAVAQFEWEMMLERQREGIAKDSSRNNISTQKCFGVRWLQWSTLLLSPHALMP
jgi:hypothetical protein